MRHGERADRNERDPMGSFELYQKLKPFLRLETETKSIIYSGKDTGIFIKKANMPGSVLDYGVYGTLRWRPNKTKWKQPTYEQFCQWYNLELDYIDDYVTSPRRPNDFQAVNDLFGLYNYTVRKGWIND